LGGSLKGKRWWLRLKGKGIIRWIGRRLGQNGIFWWLFGLSQRHLLVAGELLGGGSHGSKGSEGLSDFGGSLLSGSS